MDNRDIIGIVRLPSKLYHTLSVKGGDSLLSVYSTLKLFKGRQIKYKSYKAGNNKFVGGYSLLRAKTTLSLKTLKTYVPMLRELGLIDFKENGDVVLLGNNQLKTSFNRKLVPVAVCTRLADTKVSVVSVRLHSMARQQQSKIEKKTNLRDLLMQDISNVKSLKQLKRIKNAQKKHDLETLNLTDKLVLSIQGYAVLKDGTKNNKSKGAYWKKRLKEKGLVTTSRRFKLLDRKKLSYNDYKMEKLYSVHKSNVTYINGCLAEELCSSFSPINIIDSFNIYYSNLN